MSLAPSLKLTNLGNNFFYGLLFFTLFTANVKIFQFLRLSTKFLAFLRLSVNPIETLINARFGYLKRPFSFSFFSHRIIYMLKDTVANY